MAQHVKVSDEIEALRKRREKLDAKLREAQARQKEQEREEQEKRRLIAGTVFLDFMAANPDSELARTLSQLLDKHLTRAIDRALFPALVSVNGASANVAKPD